MATNENLIPIPGRLHSLASEGHVVGADEVYDDTLERLQSDINADVKVMGASGENHSKGLVPDPGATAGTSKFLREDGTWQTPAGSSYTAGDGIDITNNAISVKAGTNLSIDASGNLNATDTTYSTMGASGSTHAGGLVPDTPSTAGTTKFLREDGSWQEPSGSIPSQAGNNGKFLTTNGSIVSWADIPSDNTKTDKLPMTGAGAATENNFVAIDANGNIKDSGKNENSFLTQHQSIKTINSASIVGSGNLNLQTPLTFDSTPTANSDNPVKSGGVKTYVDNGLSEKVSKSNTAGLLKNDGTVDTNTYLSDLNKFMVYFEPGWTDNWTKVEFTGVPLFYFEAHGYFASKYLNLSLFFSVRDTCIKTVHLNTNDGKYTMNAQGDLIIYKESNTVFYIYCDYNTNALMLLFSNNSAMTLTYNVSAPSTSGLTKLFELDDYNGMDDF